MASLFAQRALRTERSDEKKKFGMRKLNPSLLLRLCGLCASVRTS
jgi:hypothetical protein